MLILIWFSCLPPCLLFKFILSYFIHFCQRFSATKDSLLLYKTEKIAQGFIFFEKLTNFNKKSGTLVNFFKRTYTLFFVIMGWVLFRASSLPNAVNYYKALFGLSHNNLFDNTFIIYLKQNSIFIIIGIVLSTPIFRILKIKFENTKIYNIISGLGLIILFILSLSNIVNDTYNPFIYFNF